MLKIKVLKKINIHFDLNKNSKLEINIKKIIIKFTGNEEGLVASNKSITKAN